MFGLSFQMTISLSFHQLSNDSGITMNSIDHIWTYESTETNYDSLGDATSNSSETRMEYFSSDGQFIAAQEDMGGITYLYDECGANCWHFNVR